MKRLCILAATVAMISCFSVADAQQRGGKDKNASSQSDGQSGEQKSRGNKGGGGQRSSGLFRLLDLDRDGNLSAKEIDGAVAALMKLDKNKDGVLDAQELTVSGRGVGQRGQRGGRGGKNKGSQSNSMKSGN